MIFEWSTYLDSFFLCLLKGKMLVIRYEPWWITAPWRFKTEPPFSNAVIMSTSFPICPFSTNERTPLFKSWALIMFFYANGSSLNYLGNMSGLFFSNLGFAYFLFPNCLPSGKMLKFCWRKDSPADFLRLFIFSSTFSEF